MVHILHIRDSSRIPAVTEDRDDISRLEIIIKDILRKIIGFLTSVTLKRSAVCVISTFDRYLIFIRFHYLAVHDIIIFRSLCTPTTRRKRQKQQTRQTADQQKSLHDPGSPRSQAIAITHIAFILSYSSILTLSCVDSVYVPCGFRAKSQSRLY